MKIVLVNGSPKPAKSNSGFLLAALEPLVAEGNELVSLRVNPKPLLPSQVEELCSADAIVLAFPLYVDAIPSQLMSVLVEVEALRRRDSSKRVRVYALINNGFYEGQQSRIAVDILRHWCDRCGFQFGMAVGQGAGEMLGSMEKVPLGHGPLKNLGKAMEKLAAAIRRGDSAESVHIQPNFPRIAWRLAAVHGFWHPTAKKNGLKKKDLLRRF
ncbi:flavodoxin family protein [Gorillibacterium sp. sgz500922]|uniref:flavodoxin family protein n=1 Tax=Gorillibacterium sp. sgz500922 TaxID=3446694 RepID=UPI003F66FD93